jgi:hypothetical protein
LVEAGGGGAVPDFGSGAGVGSGNLVYGAFNLIRMGVVYWRHHREDFANIVNKHV